jgi:serine-type D-Ala-D-Ala carboxypeptidase (penicillin-binding protein 5/6)
VLLFLLAAAAFWRAETEPTPALRLHPLLAAHVTLPGKPPRLAWPGEGEAAVAVEGLGSFGAIRAQKPVPIASVAKVMTAYITLREYPLAPGAGGFSVRISAADVAEEHERVALDQSTVRVKKGERLSERQALEALMLPSANNVAALLAVHDAGSIPRFVGEMNRTAAELGMTSTTYTDPSGFEEGTVSTATDQVKLARAAMRNPEFARIVGLPSARLPVAGRVVNYNELVGHDGFVGIKTGSDEAAGGCLLFARHVTVAGHVLTVVGAVLGQRQGELVDAALASADRLAGSAVAAIGVKTALPAGTPVLVARNASGGRVVATTAEPVREVGWAGQTLPIRAAVLPPAKALDEGQVVARVAVDGPRVGRTLVRAAGALGPPSLGWRLVHLF